MGTLFSFTLDPGPVSRHDVGTAIDSACHRIHRLERLLTTWDPESPLNQVRRGELSLGAAPPEIRQALDRCRVAKELSEGWFDPWSMPGGVDPTGLVKGWAVEEALEVLRGAGVAAALVEGGGDIAVFGQPERQRPWRIGIRHPWRPDALACIVAARHAVATSGSYERGPHLIDPHTGCPVQAAASATVVGPTLTFADALATALAVGGPAVLEAVDRLEGYEAYLVGADGSESSTTGMPFCEGG